MKMLDHPNIGEYKIRALLKLLYINYTQCGKKTHLVYSLT